jgi:hypothetical protein
MPRTIENIPIPENIENNPSPNNTDDLKETKPNFSHPDTSLSMKKLQSATAEKTEELVAPDPQFILDKIIHDHLLIPPTDLSKLKVNTIKFKLPSIIPNKYNGILEFGRHINQFAEYAKILDKYIVLYNSLNDIKDIDTNNDKEAISNLLKKYYHIDPAQPGFSTESNQELMVEKIHDLSVQASSPNTTTSNPNNSPSEKLDKVTIYEIAQNFKQIFTFDPYKKITNPQMYGYDTSEQAIKQFQFIKKQLNQEKQINAFTISQYFKMICANPNIEEDLQIALSNITNSQPKQPEKSTNSDSTKKESTLPIILTELYDNLTTKYQEKILTQPEKTAETGPTKSSIKPPKKRWFGLW